MHIATITDKSYVPLSIRKLKLIVYIDDNLSMYVNGKEMVINYMYEPRQICLHFVLLHMDF